MPSLAYPPRLIEPLRENRYYFKDNVFEQSGYGMPNCTAYTWGRIYELTGVRPTLSTGNAGEWFDNTGDGYRRGQTPRVGAIACFRQPGTDHGHVAVVEDVYPDGSYQTSNSDYGGRFFHLAEMQPGEGYGRSEFQGFIYAGGEWSGRWFPPNRFLNQQEQQHNADYVIRYLRSAGWTDNAIAGLLGNMEVESTINPGIWENLTVDRERGYGLVQWTPATKFIDYVGAANGWDAAFNRQMDRINWEMTHGGGEQYYPTSSYPESASEFIKSTRTPYYLAGAWLYNYERPAAPDPVDRGHRAEKWYEYIIGKPPKPPVPGRGLPLWMLIKITRGEL